jgi:hypothetical protein
LAGIGLSLFAQPKNSLPVGDEEGEEFRFL